MICCYLNNLSSFSSFQFSRFLRFLPMFLNSIFFFQFSGKVSVFVKFSSWLTLWYVVTAKSTIWQFLSFMLINMLDLLAVLDGSFASRSLREFYMSGQILCLLICLIICLNFWPDLVDPFESLIPREFYLSYIQGKVMVCTYTHYQYGNDLNFLHNFEWITFPTQSYLCMLFVQDCCIHSLLHLSPHSLHFQYSKV